jgi:NADPH-dependent 2,4-dienoyl-CoA reductase/sulfur reductase-like enzyme
MGGNGIGQPDFVIGGDGYERQDTQKARGIVKRRTIERGGSERPYGSEPESLYFREAGLGILVKYWFEALFPIFPVIARSNQKIFVMRCPSTQKIAGSCQINFGLT